MDIKEKLQDLPVNIVIAYAVKCMCKLQSVSNVPIDTPGRQELINAIGLAISTGEQYSAKTGHTKEEQQTLINNAQKVEREVAGHTLALAQMAIKLSKAVESILYVKPAEDPNAKWIWDKAIENHTWDIAQDILADETRKSLQYREAEAEKHKLEIACKAALEIFLTASSHINSEILLAELDTIIAQYMLKSSKQ